MSSRRCNCWLNSISFLANASRSLELDWRAESCSQCDHFLAFLIALLAALRVILCMMVSLICGGFAFGRIVAHEWHLPVPCFLFASA